MEIILQQQLQPQLLLHHLSLSVPPGWIVLIGNVARGFSVLNVLQVKYEKKHTNMSISSAGECHRYRFKCP